MTTRHNRHKRGVLMIELAIATFVVALLGVLTAQTLMHFAQTRAHYAAREAAVWAAEAQLARVQVGAAIDSNPPEGLIPNFVSLETTAEPGTGDWAGMDLIRVRATVTPKHQRPIVEEVRGYVVREQTP